MHSTLNFEINKSFIEEIYPGPDSLVLLNERCDISCHLGVKFGLAGKLLICSFLIEKTGNDLFHKLAEKILVSLVKSWDSKSKSWPDFDAHVSSVKEHYHHIKQYAENKTFFEQPKVNKSFESGDQGIYYAINYYYIKSKVFFGPHQAEQLSSILEHFSGERIQSQRIEFTIDDAVVTYFKEIKITDLVNIWAKLLYPKTLSCLNKMNIQSFYLEAVNDYLPPQAELEELIDNKLTSIKKHIKDEIVIKFIESSFDIDKNVIEIKNQMTNKALLRAEELYLNIEIDEILNYPIEIFSKIPFRITEYVAPFINVVQEDYDGSLKNKNILIVVLTNSEINIEIEDWQYNFLGNFLEKDSFSAVYERFCEEENLIPNEIIHRKAQKLIRRLVFNKILRPC